MLNQSKKRHPLDPAYWNYLKLLGPSKPRYVYIACRARLIPNPKDALLPPIPWIERPGVSFRHRDKTHYKWLKRRSNRKWIYHIMEMSSEYKE